MATGMAAATLAQTAAALGIAPTAATLAMPSSEVANSGALLAATALLTFLGLARTAQAVGAAVLPLACVAAFCLADTRPGAHAAWRGPSQQQ